MNLPAVVSTLIETQNNQDSKGYSENFTETAMVTDEGHSYTGRPAIRDWIARANQNYSAIMKAVKYTGSKDSGTLTAEISGSFPGSPITLQYQLKFEGDLISSLAIGE